MLRGKRSPPPFFAVSRQTRADIGMRARVSRGTRRRAYEPLPAYRRNGLPTLSFFVPGERSSRARNARPSLGRFCVSGDVLYYFRRNYVYAITRSSRHGAPSKQTYLERCPPPPPLALPRRLSFFSLITRGANRSRNRSVG